LRDRRARYSVHLEELVGCGIGRRRQGARRPEPAAGVFLIVLVYYDTSGGLTWTSVCTVDSGSADLQETYLSNVGFPGDPRVTGDLSAKYGNHGSVRRNQDLHLERTVAWPPGERCFSGRGSEGRRGRRPSAGLIGVLGVLRALQDEAEGAPMWTEYSAYGMMSLPG